MLFPDDIYVAVISARRPAAVPLLESRLPQAPTWYVAEGDGEAYRRSGAAHVIESGALTRSRNQAMEDAFARDAWCLQISDDLTSCHRAISKKEKVEISVWDAVTELKKEMEKVKAKLGGAAPTKNEYFFNPAKPVKSSAFIVGDFLLIAPSKPRFDERMRLKEDYQLTLDHMICYGRVCRYDRLLMGFKHRDNPGGAVSYRTPELEQQAIQYLKKKYGSMIRNNPKRKDEILLSIR